MTRKLRQKILRSLSLALVGAALTVGAVQAERADDQGGMLGVGAVAASSASTADVPDVFMRAVARATGGTARPDDRGEPRGPGAYLTASPVPTTLVPSDDFQWRDASAGAGATLVAVLLAAGLTISIRHRGRAAVS